MMPAVDIRQVGSARAILGEGIVHDADSDTLTFLDIPESKAWSINPDGEGKEISLGPEAAFACVCDNGQILAGGANGLYLDGKPIRGGFLLSDEVLNDGAVHPLGNFLVCGSRHRTEESPLGHMWCLGRTLTRLPWKFTVFNGPAFSPCGTRIYFADSPERTIYVAPVDVMQLTIGPREVFAEVPEEHGYPDGMICDSDGGIWSAHWDGGCVTRYLSNGEVDRRVDMPTKRPTSLAFRGTTMFVTSARVDETPNDDDMGGHVFAFDAGFKGASSPRLSDSIRDSIKNF